MLCVAAQTMMEKEQRFITKLVFGSIMCKFATRISSPLAFFSISLAMSISPRNQHDVVQHDVSHLHARCCCRVLLRFVCERRRLMQVVPRCCWHLHWPLRGGGRGQRQWW